jgi:Luciferase-like monooxygenase
MELGIYTFGDITPDPNTGRTISISQRYAEILAAAKLADEAGLDVFGVGEHHRLDIPISSPAAIMAAIAGGTKRIRLTSAVTILSTLGDWRRLDERIESLSSEIEAIARQDAGCERLMSVPGIGPANTGLRKFLLLTRSPLMCGE